MTETAKTQNGHLTSGRLLARNAVWNLLGNGAPMIVAVVCIPILIRGLGKDRFGVLTLAWALIGYASLFDLGLGRALVAGSAVVLLISLWLAGRGLVTPRVLILLVLTFLTLASSLRQLTSTPVGLA